MFAVRQIGASDLPEVQRIFLLRNQVGKEQLEPDAAKEHASRFYEAIENSQAIIWGAFDGKMLAAYLCQEFAFSRYHWLMSFLATNPEVGAPWNYRLNGLDALWEAAFLEGKKRGKRSVVWSLPGVWAKTASRIQHTSTVWKDYHIHQFATVKAGEVPSNPFDRWVSGSRPKSYDVVLRCAWKNSTPALGLLEATRLVASQNVFQRPPSA